ncbi:HEAT repeat domain-containing protein [Okeania sp. SIO1I7]|uniref:HEAT repeat domain-containing protein n=1 Tax=Okeania sp. SIO1I7 TaxID=2607772 RepID=UPI0013FAF8C4|nr:HEAT repeat domain-containing protein [Okeania sp. SIO1I7]NET27222.1 MFS transporter [Okeania sp. SIO1I7]
MEQRSLKNYTGLGDKLLISLNLRSEEVERTLLMFIVYTLTSVGLIWLELSTVSLFLDEYGADQLPWIYIASAVIGSGLGFIYSWLQKIMPLRRVIVVILLLMAAPLFLFRFGIGIENIQIAGLSLAFLTTFMMWLWVEACYLLNDLNTSITSNQLFNIREIKRTYPIISSGFLVAGVISGFSLPLVLYFAGLSNVTIISGLMIVCGSGILLFLSEKYQQSFPDSSRWIPEEEEQEFSTRKIKGPLQGYILPLITFFVIAEVLYVLIDFQFFYQLELQNQTTDGASKIATFLGLFEGILSTCQVATQWFASSRLVERIGVFGTAMILPIGAIALGLFSFTGAITGLFSVFIGLVILRFLDELLHYTLIETTGPVLFQPLPENIRSDVQTMVNGVAEPFSTGLSGLIILAILWLCRLILNPSQSGFQDRQGLIFVIAILIFGLVWLGVIWLIRSQYVGLLVRSAGKGRLGVLDVDMRALKRSVVETLEKGTAEEDKRSCIELLSQIDKKNVGEILAPLLPLMSSELQCQSLEVMLNHPNPTYLEQVRSLAQTSVPPEVLALALRYIWLTESEPDINQIRPYLQPSVDPVVRGTAAALIMRRGDRGQKAEATNVLRRMITSKLEKERVMGVRALGEADYLQGLRLYVPSLLQDESLRVRKYCMDVIAATHLESYYPSLLRGLSYKSTREAALQALVRLGNDGIPMLVKLADDSHKSDLVRLQAWNAIGEIGTIEALDALVNRMMTTWGMTRRNILRRLLTMPGEVGIEGVLERVGRSGVEILIEQELMFLGQVYAGIVDLSGVDMTSTNTLSPIVEAVNGKLTTDYTQMLLRALQLLELDAIERCFLLMKFLYPLGSIQAAAFNIKSESRSNIARGLEILDNTVDISCKRSLIDILDQHGYQEKLSSLSEMVVYKLMAPSERLRHLLDLRHFLSDWALACCLQMARAARWSLTAEQTLVCLRHPTGFVREAALAYLRMASQRALVELLPNLRSDPDPLVAAQVEQMIVEFGIG